MQEIEAVGHDGPRESKHVVLRLRFAPSLGLPRHRRPGPRLVKMFAVRLVSVAASFGWFGRREDGTVQSIRRLPKTQLFYEVGHTAKHARRLINMLRYILDSCRA